MDDAGVHRRPDRARKCSRAVGEPRRAEWESFLAQREPEVREPNPKVANYEKRPQPITFQHPFSVKG